jgi:hypothetical protein
MLCVYIYAFIFCFYDVLPVVSSPPSIPPPYTHQRTLSVSGLPVFEGPGLPVQVTGGGGPTGIVGTTVTSESLPERKSGERFYLYYGSASTGGSCGTNGLTGGAGAGGGASASAGASADSDECTDGAWLIGDGRAVPIITPPGPDDTTDGSVDSGPVAVPAVAAAGPVAAIPAAVSVLPGLALRAFASRVEADRPWTPSLGDDDNDDDDATPRLVGR